MAISTLGLAVPPAIVALILHLGFFIRGEHLLNAPSLVLLAVVAPSSLCCLLTLQLDTPFLQSLQIVLILGGSFAVSLAASIFSYRLLFHPLKAYPGPRPARLSKLWHLIRNVQGDATYRLLDQLHAQYGDYVRTGPNELSIIDSDIIEAVYGAQSKCIKTQWYDVGLPMTTLHQMRDRNLHDRRRRAGWNQALNTKSLRAYDTRVIGFADKLTQQIDAFGGQPVNATKWFHFYGYDVMGSLGFGQSFNTLESGESHFAIDIIEQGQGVLQYTSGVPWLTRLLVKVPKSLSPIQKLLDYSNDCVQQRKSKEKHDGDVISHLIEAEDFFGDPELDALLLTGDARLVIVAGSDTTSAALAYTFFYMAADKSVVEKLRRELEENEIQNDDTFSITSLQNLSYMNGVINEALRLHPPVPGGVFRQTPAEGLHVGDRFIPGNVNILTPHYSLQRSPRNFGEPNSFIPERWTSRPDLVVAKNAFFPFTSGPYGCIGKQLALNEMRTVVSKLVLEFDISLAPGESGHNLFNMDRDIFTILPGDLQLCFTRRK